MIERREKKQASTQAKPRPAPPKPFDLYDIPQAMKKAGFPVAAKLSQQWLDGPAYSAFGTDEPGKADEQRYPDALVDTRSVTLDWLLGHPKVKRRYEALLGNLITSNSLREMRRNIGRHLSTYSPISHELDTRSHCQGDLQTMHTAFQFQYETVDMLDTLTDTLGMTDLTAALANFNFYAAVANAQVTTSTYQRYNTPKGAARCRKSTVTITHVWIYAKDSYSFHDGGQSSQYLGHWNRHGVIVLPAAVAASVGMKRISDATHLKGNPTRQQEMLNWLNAQRLELWNSQIDTLPVDIGSSLSERDVYYPVRNRDYRNWRQTKNRGGDFLIFSDLRKLRLNQPIVLDMDEVCE